MNTLPQGLASLPDELILFIFENILLITNKRQFLKTCKKFNTITKQSFLEYENNYYVKNFAKINNYCVEKFTLELCHDKYFDWIPLLYIKPKNDILIQSLSYFNCIKLLELAKCNGCKLQNIDLYAALNGHLDVLQWAHKNNCGNNLLTCSNAALNGHLHVLKWAHENGFRWSVFTCTFAALNGHLSCLQYLHDNGCEWDRWTCSNAAYYGHLDCLKYARENGCNWDNSVYNYARNRGHKELLNWALENGCPK